ncbi:MAG: hypothetical protein KC619_07925 [Myxococcales bacterium]|nr:hypothetical protein [Myxococcales bacterium]
MSTRAFVALAAATLVACGDPSLPPDGGLMRDAAVGDGGGLLDGGPIDAALPAADAGVVDAGEPLCDTAACDPREPGMGCASEDCLLWGTAPTCGDGTMGRLGAGMPCTAVGQCAPGLACFQDGSAGVCGRVCCPTDGAACAVGSRCGGSGVLVDGTDTLWGQCLSVRSCDLLRADSCEAREGCYLIDATMMTECRIAGAAGAGEACEVQEDCRAGFFCGGVLGARRCVRICDLRADDCPTAEGRCVAQSHTVAFENVGLCTLDMMTAARL